MEYFSLKPCLRKEIIILSNDADKIVLYDDIFKSTYRLGKIEYEILASFDGYTTIMEICNRYNNYKFEEIIKLYKYFDDRKLFDKQNNYDKSFLLIKKKLYSFDDILDNNILVNILAQEILVFSIITFVVGLLGLLLANDYESQFRLFLLFIKNNKILVLIFLILSTMISVSIHEFAHAIVAKKYGCNIMGIGIMVNFGILSAYTDISGITFLQSKKEKILIYIAGILANFQLAGIGMIIGFITKNISQNLAYVFSLNNILFAVFNMTIFIKLDGYHILTEILDEPELWENSILWIKKRKFKYDSSIYSFYIIGIFICLVTPLLALLVNFLKCTFSR